MKKINLVALLAEVMIPLPVFLTVSVCTHR